MLDSICLELETDLYYLLKSLPTQSPPAYAVTLLTVPSQNPLVFASNKHESQFCSCPVISSSFGTSGLHLTASKYSEDIFLNIKIDLKFIFLLFASKHETTLE